MMLCVMLSVMKEEGRGMKREAKMRAFSDLGSGALTVACDRHVSGLQLEADGSFGAIGDQVALSRRRDDILMADFEDGAVDVQDNITEDENEVDIQYLDIAADS
eukprot:scaffold453_cov278-Chaetoceros_neogracile.AAC.7